MTWGEKNKKILEQKCFNNGRTGCGSKMHSADPFRKLDVGNTNLIYVNCLESSGFVYSDICPTTYIR